MSHPRLSFASLVFALTAAAGFPPQISARGDAPVAEQVPAPAAPQVWQGQIDLGVARLDFVARLTPSAEGAPATGTLDIPMQGINGAALKSVTFMPAKPAEGDAAALPAGFVFTFSYPGTPDAVFTMSQDASDPAKASGTLSQMGQSFPVSMTRLKEGEAPKGPDRPQHPAPPFPYEVAELKFPGGKGPDGLEVTLTGTITMPKEGGPHPAAVLVSGSGPQDRDETLLGHKPFLVLADALTRAGVAVLRYDDRGVGASGGDFAVSTTDDFADDAEAAFRALARQPGIDPGRIGIIGHSEGGLIAPIVASRNKEVAFLVLLAGTGLDGKETLKSQLAAIQRAGGVPEDNITKQVEAQQALLQLVIDGAEQERVLAAMRRLIAIQQGVPEPTDDQLALIPDEVVRNAIQGLENPWMKRFLVIDPRESLRRTVVPVLALNGELDTQVIASIHLPEIRKALVEAGNTDITILGVNGVNHLFQTAQSGSPAEYASISETISPGVLGKVTAWVRQRTGLEPMPDATQTAPASPAQLPKPKTEAD